MKPVFAYRIVSLALSGLLLAGCAELAQQKEPVPGDAMQAVNRHYNEAIALDGRLSVQYQQNRQDQALHGSFRWRQTAEHTSVTLMSPLGQILAVIEVDPGSATLTQSGQAPRVANDVDQLAAQSLGWPLPVAGLRSWLQGFATDAQGKRVIATPATKAFTSNDGWDIEYVSWDESDPAQVHPKRIDLQRDTEQAGNVKMRIVIDQWQAR
ncbi:MAG TPA: lipoprotein insertase outer membrane protein LolB [Oxalicibacterium sp.]|jgi:outer membrane lipoprotein LolB|nr:lipoprotein insertase outer membrane protein LolB [Oxalicibacterium sp.]